MKKKLNNEKGITLIILIFVIMIMLILVGAVVTNIDTGADIRNYQYMRADIELLESKIMIYYNEKGTIPTMGNTINVSEAFKEKASLSDNENYYQINIDELYNITLNYGGGTIENQDIYIINEQSHNVYYLKGAAYENETYYTYTTRSGVGN